MEEKKKGGESIEVVESKRKTIKSVCTKEVKRIDLKKESVAEEHEKQESKITPEIVADELYNVYLRCMQEVPVMAKDKETGKQVQTGVYQFDARCALKALQLLGDAVGLFKGKSAGETESCSYEDFLKSGGYEYEF